MLTDVNKWTIKLSRKFQLQVGPLLGSIFYEMVLKQIILWLYFPCPVVWSPRGPYCPPSYFVLLECHWAPPFEECCQPQKLRSKLHAIELSTERKQESVRSYSILRVPRAQAQNHKLITEVSLAHETPTFQFKGSSLGNLFFKSSLGLFLFIYQWIFWPVQGIKLTSWVHEHWCVLPPFYLKIQFINEQQTLQSGTLKTSPKFSLCGTKQWKHKRNAFWFLSLEAAWPQN